MRAALPCVPSLSFNMWHWFDGNRASLGLTTRWITHFPPLPRALQALLAPPRVCTTVPRSCVLCISHFAQCCPHSFLTFSGLMLSLGATQPHHFGCSRAVAESCYQIHSSRAWGKSLGVCLASPQWSPRARRCQIKPPVSDFSPSVCPMHPQQQLWAVQSQAIAPNKFLWTPTCRATAAVSQSCLNMVLIWLDIFNAPTCLKLEEI